MLEKLDVLKHDNIEKLFGQFMAGVDMYPTIVGADLSSQQSMVDGQKQRDFAEWLASAEVEYFDFKPGNSPLETYQSGDSFIRAISKDFDVDNIGHRLYFNFGDNKVDFMAFFMNACKDMGLPFCIKCDKKYDRHDSVVVYVENNRLQEVSSVLQRIVSLYPEFAEKKELPMSAVSGGWFAYAKEPEGNGSQSYNRRFVNCIEGAFSDPVIFSKYRDAFNIADNAGLSDFAKELHRNAEDSMLIKYGAMKEHCGVIYENHEAMRERFDELALQIYKTLFGLGDDRGAGFAPRFNDEGMPDGSMPIITVSNPKSGFVMNVSSIDIMNTVINLVRRHVMTFDWGRNKDKFLRELAQGVSFELKKSKMIASMPDELKSITSEALMGRQTEYEHDFGM